MKSVQSIKKLNYKDKLLKKGLKNRLKKKTKQEERNLKRKLVRMDKTKGAGVKRESNPTDEENVAKTPKPVFNRDGKMVFSKFDFSGLGSTKNDKKVEKDPKKILKNLEKQKARIAEMEQSGDKEKAKEVKQKHAWKMALAKSEGLKVKDDPILLKKTIKKQEQKHKDSAKKWKVRQDGVNKAQEIRQQKRTENIEKRKKEKKNKKLKQASKRGRIIPGF